MQTVFKLSETLQDDLNEFAEQTERFKGGAISAAEFRSFRVPRGVYEQRESDTYMLRVRFPAGIVLPEQMRVLAAVAEKYGNGVLHATTRQDIQIHRVLLDDISPALGELAAAGMSTKGGGGNTVRNITGCYDSGVCAREQFDPSPYVIGVTEFLLPDPLSYQLPRKYKIAFSGCDGDCAGATVNDLGFIAKRRSGSLGFAVYIGGGMGASARVADQLESFIPAEEVHLVAEAVKRVFDQHGNRRNRQKARLRFLLEQIGLDGFRSLYEKQLSALRQSSTAELVVRALPGNPPSASAGGFPPKAGFAEWQERYTVPQKQEGYYLVQIPLTLGDIAAEGLEKLADVVEQFGERMARTTQRQNLVLRWVHQRDLAAVHSRLSELDLAGDEPQVTRDMVACTGAATCRLGICLSRGLAKAIHQALTGSGLDLHGLGELTINISGCPNACGRHPTADIGLFGAARRVGGRLVPHYVLQLGGRVAEGSTRLAQGQNAIPARGVPALLVDFLQGFGASGQRPDFGAFLEAGGWQLAEKLSQQYKSVPDFSVDKDYYFDWDAEELFSLAGRGPGECGAGVFDLIEVDLQSARDAVGSGQLFEATVLAARALLVTRGQQASDSREALSLFGGHFLDENLVDQSFAALIAEALEAAQSSEPRAAFRPESTRVSSLVAAVEHLYASMDASLRFKPASTDQAAPKPLPDAANEQTAPRPDREVDFRGVVCPLNYVKTKMVLGQMRSGAILAILLDEAGARNVPASVEKDGHEVLSVEMQHSQWRVLVRKT